MTITWHGFSCFSIAVKTGLKETATLVIDPYDNSTGLRFPRTLTADIVACSEDQHDHSNNVGAVLGKPFVITEAGEYESQGVFIYGISAPRSGEKKKEKRLLFRVAAEGLSLAHLGALDRPLTNEELANFENVDILMLPVGGGEVLDPKKAGELIGQIEPRLVIPMFYDLPNIKMKLLPVDKFLKEIGADKTEVIARLKIEKKDLPEEDMEIKVLERN